MAERNLGIRISLKDADTVKRGLEALGKDGQAALRRIEQGSKPASDGLLALNKVSGDLRGRLDELGGRAGTLGSVLSGLGPGGFAAAAGIGAAVAALGILYVKGKEALSFADDIGDVADKLQITAEQLQEIRFAFNGLVQPGQVDAGLTALTKNIGLAEAGVKKALIPFKALHVELKDSNGQWKSNIEVLSDVADHIAALKSPEEQLAIATKLFGDAGADMVAVFRNGSPVLKDAADRLREMNGIISNEDVARAGALQQQLDDLAVTIKAQLVQGFLAVGPQIVTFTRTVGENLPKLVQGAASAVKWLSDNLTDLLEIAAAAAGVIAGGLIGSALGPLGTIIGAIAGGYAGMKLAVDRLEGSTDDLNKVQRTTKQLLDEINTSGQINLGLTRDQALAVAELARQRAADNVEAAKQLANDAAAARSVAQQEVRDKTVDLGSDFAADKSVQYYVDPGAQRRLNDAEARERTTSFALADAMEALRAADKRIDDLSTLPSRPDAPVTGAAPGTEGGISPTPVGGSRNRRGLPDRLGSLGDESGADKGNPFADQLRDLQASLALQRQLNAAYLDGGAAVGRITRELELQQKINQISAKYTPDQKRQVEDLLRQQQAEQQRGKVLEKGADLQDQITLAQREMELAGETEEVRNRELAVLRAKLDLQKQGVDLQSEEAQRVLRNTARLADAGAAIARQKDLYGELGDLAGGAFDRIGQALTQLAVANGQVAVDFQQVWAGVLSELEQAFIRLAVLNPLKNALGLNDGKTLPTIGDIGGLLGGAVKWIGGLFGPGNAGPAITLPTSPGTIGVSPLPNAMGNAFDRYGVVDRPTFFRFANGGFGEFGEAGPEAIMPLTRLPNGNLGVAAANQNDGGAGPLQVVINNYEGAKVQAKESRDGRGGRRLEVSVGEMFAQEASRPGSTTQRGVAAAQQGPKRR